MEKQKYYNFIEIYTILKKIEFTSERKRMTVILKYEKK